MATKLYEQMLAFNYEDPKRRDLMHQVWAPTPWMADVFTDGTQSGRYHNIRQWLRDRYGRPASSIHGIKGTWQHGSATIFGWTWFGFATKEQMNEFLAAWTAAPKQDSGREGS